MTGEKIDPREVWDLLDLQNDVEKLVSDLIDGSCNVALISGPPGAGKTWLARKIGANFTEAGGVSFRGVGDETEANRRLFSMKCIQSETKGYFKPIAVIGKSIANITTKLATGGLTDAQGALEALSAESARRKQSVTFLDSDEQNILADISREVRDKPILLIADNLHWWDKDSLSLLRMLIDGRLSEAFPFVRNIRVLAVTTDENYQQPIWHDDYTKYILPKLKRKIHLRYLSSDDFYIASKIINPEFSIDRDTAQFIFKLSGGHLLIFNNALRYLSELDRVPENEELSRLADDMFLERLRRIGSLGDLAESFLTAASVIGSVFERREISCLLKNESGSIHDIVNKCQELGFIEEKKNRLEFRHDYIRRFFSKRAGKRAAELREVLSGCLKQLTPSDYLRRAENYFHSNESKQAVDFFVLTAIDNIRKGRSVYHLVPKYGIKLIEENRYDIFVNEFAECYEHLSSANSHMAQYIIEGWGEVYSEPVLAEIEYLRSQFYLNSRNTEQRHLVIERLGHWKNFVGKEFDIGIRLMILLRGALILERDKSRARSIDTDITRLLSERIHFDQSAEKTLHALGRSAEGLVLPEIAIRRVERAEIFFRPDGDNIPSDPSEYFRCLNNMSALSITMNKYEDAERYAKKGIDLADKFSKVVFPRQDFIRSMLLFSQYREGRISAKNAAMEQLDVIINYGAEDPYYAQNYRAVYHCLANEFSEAIEILEEAIDNVINLDSFESNPYYFISSNLCAARYLKSYNSIDALEHWDNLLPIVESIPYETRPILVQRHTVLREVLKNNIRLTAEEWDLYPISTVSRPLSPCWNELGRGFRMPDVQFWSMF